MFPTPDPTYQVFQQRLLEHSMQNGVQILQPVLTAMLISMVIALIVIGLLAWVIYRNKEAIKKFFRD